MKKIFSLMLIMATIFSFVACGCQEDPQDDPEKDPGTSENGGSLDKELPLLPLAPDN